ncbi:MAG: hypothetical protein ABIV28_04710 [Longimicrobiales bacterium]
MPRNYYAAVTFLALMLLLPPNMVRAQDDTSRVVVDTTRGGSAGWDTPRILALISRAAERRARPRADTALHNYKATAEGFVYFFLDRPSNDQRTLVRVNQIGLELYWRQPDEARQRIAGMRDASPLPNTMRYHLDHLTMVQNGFGDVIRMGDGDEVRDVVHPASAKAPGVYQYRLADSLQLRLPSQTEPIRVYEVQVRPRRTDRPGFVGSLFIDRTTADVIRMTFTFTPASYVDKRLDYINLSLDNGLWEGRYWLPNEQTVEIRRQLPELDFVAGSVIRGRMRIVDYKLNDTIPDSIFRNRRPVVAVSRDKLENYKFQSDIFDDIENEGLTQPPAMATLRRQAAELIGSRLMSGLPALRLSYPDVSSAIRYNRADGLFLGAGVAYSTGPPWRVHGATGYAFGSERGSALARITYAPATTAIAATGYSHALRDIGAVPAMAGIANSVSAAVLGKDYLDPWYASGVELALKRPVGAASNITLAAAAERQRSAIRSQDHALFNHGADFRGVRAIDNGTDYSLTGTLGRTMPTSGTVSWGAVASLRAGQFDSDGFYVRPRIDTDLLMVEPSHNRELRASLNASAVTADAPAQHYFMIGGTGTLPGYRYRTFAGRAGAVADVQLTQRVFYPWVGVRMLAAAGFTTALDSGRTNASAAWNVRPTDGIRTSAGAGVSLFWDLLQVDAVKGLNGGTWVLQFSFTRILDDIS